MIHVVTPEFIPGGTNNQEYLESHRHESFK